MESEMVKKRKMGMLEGKKTEKRLGENWMGISLERVQRGEGYRLSVILKSVDG